MSQSITPAPNLASHLSCALVVTRSIVTHRTKGPTSFVLLRTRKLRRQPDIRLAAFTQLASLVVRENLHVSRARELLWRSPFYVSPSSKPIKRGDQINWERKVPRQIDACAQNALCRREGLPGPSDRLWPLNHFTSLTPVH